MFPFSQRGRTFQRQLCFLPGGNQLVLAINNACVIICRQFRHYVIVTSYDKYCLGCCCCCQVVQHCIDQVCDELDLTMAERDEFTLFYVTDAGERVAMQRDDYILDVTTQLKEEGISMKLLCMRTSWVYPLDFRCSVLYMNVLYEQVQVLQSSITLLPHLE